MYRCYVPHCDILVTVTCVTAAGVSLSLRWCCVLCAGVTVYVLVLQVSEIQAADTDWKSVMGVCDTC